VNLNPRKQRGRAPRNTELGTELRRVANKRQIHLFMLFKVYFASFAPLREISFNFWLRFQELVTY